MGELILISGKSGSGKSLFAEKLIAKYNGNRYYIATMLPKTEENYKRIEKHKKQRQGLGFKTLELPYSLIDKSIEPGAVVLIEDISNLLANNIFEKNKSIDEVFDDVLSLVKKCKVVVAVTISGLENMGYNEETDMYIDSLNEINKKLYNEALVAIKMSDEGLSYEKGESYDIY